MNTPFDPYDWYCVFEYPLTAALLRYTEKDPDSVGVGYMLFTAFRIDQFRQAELIPSIFD